MANVSLSVFLPDILPEVKKCPIALINNKIVDTARDISYNTKIWQNEDAIQFTLPANTNYFDISNIIPYGAEVDSIVWMRTYSNDGNIINDIVRVDANGIVRFDSTYQTDIDIFCRFSFKPLNGSTEMPDLFFNICRFAIKHGTLYKLMSMFNTEWYNPQGAMFHNDEYDRLLARIKVERWKGRTFNNFRVNTINRFDV